MSSKIYKWCVVPECTNTSIKNPNKLFVYVPNKKNVRNKWLKLARRDPADLSIKSTIYMCEDHFDLPKDMDNYMKYHLMGSVSVVRMKPGCMPSKFDCQVPGPGRAFQSSHSMERKFSAKKRRPMAMQECKRYLEESTLITQHSEHVPTAGESAGSQINAGLQQVKTAKKSIQVYTVNEFRNKAIQTEMNSTNGTSMMPSTFTCVATVTCPESSPSTHYFQSKSLSDYSELQENNNTTREVDNT